MKKTVLKSLCALMIVFAMVAAFIPQSTVSAAGTAYVAGCEE